MFDYSSVLNKKWIHKGIQITCILIIVMYLNCVGSSPVLSKFIDYNTIFLDSPIKLIQFDFFMKKRKLFCNKLAANISNKILVIFKLCILRFNKTNCKNYDMTTLFYLRIYSHSIVPRKRVVINVVMPTCLNP